MAEEQIIEYDAKIWSDADIKLLVSIRLGMESEFLAGRRKKNVLWGKVFQELRTILPTFPYDRDDIIRKFQNLKASYHRIKKRNKLSGREASSWNYFQQFDEVYGSRHNVELPPELMAEVFIQLNETEKEAEHETPVKRAKKNIKSSNNQILEFLKKEAVEDERRHNEMLEIEKEKIDVENRRLEVLVGLKEALEKMSN